MRSPELEKFLGSNSCAMVHNQGCMMTLNRTYVRDVVNDHTYIYIYKISLHLSNFVEKTTSACTPYLFF
jgi:hypothetical protein